jgi:hypothetical protein
MRKIIFNESILDPIHKTRCKEVFDDNDIIRPEVKKFIIDTFMTWYNDLDEKDFDVVGFKLIGSSTGFQYTDISDVDVQVIAKMRPNTKFSDFIQMSKSYFKYLPNGNNLPGTAHPINYFLVDVDNPVPDIKVENRYDMSTNVWEK